MRTTKSGACALAIVALAASACGKQAATTVYPQPQRAFHALNAGCKARYEAGQNDIRKSEAFNACNHQRREFADANTISGWIGTLDVMATDQGASEVRVSIDADVDGYAVEYNTPGAGLFDEDSPNVIRPGSPVFEKLAQMKTGDRIVFDGLFLPDTDRGISESSLTEAGSMREPTFYIRLSDVRPYDGTATTTAPATASAPTAPAAAAPIASPAEPAAPRAQPGFDCAKATTAVEHLVCVSDSLSGLDRQLAASYAAARARAGDPASLARLQRNWIRTVRDACADEACLAPAYRNRIDELDGIDAPASPPGPRPQAATDGGNYVDGSGVEYAFALDADGAVLTSGAATIYLGKACDAVSPELGTGTWGWANGGFSIEFPSASIGFPRQEIDVGNDGGCRL